MSKPHKHIDDLFKKELQNLEVTPDPILWSEISKNLPQKKKKKRVIPLWFWPAGIAASLILIFTVTKLNNRSERTFNVVFEENTEEICPEDINTNIQISSKKEEESFVADPVPNSNAENKTQIATKQIHTESTAKQNVLNNRISKIAIIKKDTPKEKEALTNIGQSESTQKDWKDVTPTKKQELEKNEEKIINKLYKLKTKIIAETTDKKEATLPNKEKQLVINEILEEDTNEEEKVTPKESSKKWSIQPQIAPLVYNSVSGNSSIEATFQNNVASTETGLSYGIKVAYQASPKWQIRSGISTANIDVFTNQVLDQSLFSGEVSSIAIEKEVGVLALESAPLSDPVKNDNLLNPTLNPTTPNPLVSSVSEGVLQQQINYIEIPVEFTYRLLNKRFGTSIIGGASAFVLNQSNNQVFFKQFGDVTPVGKSNNLNNTSFSGNIGLGLDYKITDSILISVEPTIKFQFNAFDASTDFNPYIFGVYSGIKFNL